MDSKRANNASGQVMIGVAVIVVGVLFLLDNLGILEFDYAFQLWPAVFILAGVLKFTQSRSNGGRIMGGTICLAGALLLLKGLGLVYIGWGTLVPLIMIGMGLAVVFKSTQARRPAPHMLDKEAGLKDADHDSVINITALLGGIERRITTANFQGGEVTAIMGGCELDLRQAGMHDVAVLNVFAMWGGIEIKVPADWAVSLEGTPIMGAFSEKTITPPAAAKRLIIRGYAVMGGVEVRN